MKPSASKEKAIRALVARVSTTGRKRRSIDSFHTWKVCTKKSYTPAIPVACKSRRAWLPPFSPVTSTSVMAVASGYGKTPCMSRTK